MVLLIGILLGYLLGGIIENKVNSVITARKKLERSSEVEGRAARVFIHENFPEEYVPAIHWAIKNWNESLGIEVLEFAGYAKDGGGDRLELSSLWGAKIVILNWEDNSLFWKSIDSQKNCSAVTPTSTIVAGCVASIPAYNDSGRQIGHIGFITIRAHGYTTGNNFPSPSQYDFDTIILHEFGHALGFHKHLDDEETWNSRSLVMFRRVDNGRMIRTLKQADLDAIQKVI